MSAGSWAWAMQQGARDPYVILVLIYVFMPYFAGTVVGDPVAGQAAVARAGTIAGWTVALTAPLLGVSLDRLGPRKPWLAICIALMVPLIASLWWTTPDGTGLSVGAVVAIAATIAVLFGWTEMLHNSMLPRIAGPVEASYASGAGIGLGNAVSVGLLILVLWGLALPGKVDLPFIPDQPLFGLTTASHEPDRAVALLAAGVLAIGSLPLFFLSRDAPRTGVSAASAFASSPRLFWRMLRDLRGDRDSATFLVARMIFADGKAGLLIFGGIYAAGVLGFTTLDLLTHGVLLSIFAAIGAFSAGALENRVGPRRALQIELAGAVLFVVLQLSSTPTRLLFVPTDASAQIWDVPILDTLPKLLYMLFGLGTAVFVAAAFASSRSLLARLAPPDRVATYFGLYALSGYGTMWLAPLLIGIVTTASRSQEAGVFVIVALILVGWAMLFAVRGGGPVGKEPVR